jgi:topoisomerase-4 subunit B
MPPLYRIDAGKNVYYALDDHERDGVLQRIEAEKIKAKVSIQRFKGLGEMNPMQLRETTMNRDTRRLVQLTLDANDGADSTIDMLLAKGRAADRKEWLTEEGNKAEILE